MRKSYFIPLTILFSACLYLLSFSEVRPAMMQCASIHVRLSEGWWLSINDDGSGAYGFGTGMVRVEVVKNTFNFEQVYADIDKVFLKKPANAEEPYMAVSYYRKGNSSAVEHRLAIDRHLLSKLFLLARANPHPAVNDFDIRSHNQLEKFWRSSPWKEKSHLPPNKANSADEK